MSTNYYSEDPYIQARARTRREGQPGPWAVVKKYILSLPGAPAQERFTYAFVQSLGYEKSVIIPDLNKYNRGVNLHVLKEEMGIEHVILRMGGPTQFVMDNFNLTEDPTWRDYFNQAVKEGYKSIGGYWVYSAGVDSQDYINGHGNFDFIRDCMSGGYIPDYIIADDEVNTWIEHGQKVYATAVNQVSGLKNIQPKIWDKWRKTTAEYTARWFVNQVTPSGSAYLPAYQTWMDNYNVGYKTRGVAGKNMLNWWAWYISEFNGKTAQYSKESEVINAIPLPTSDQVNKLLTVGECALYDIHQFTATMVTPYYMNAAGQPAGLDWSITRYSESEFMAAINKTTTPPPPPPPPPPTDDLKGRVDLIEADLASLAVRVAQAGRVMTGG